MDLYPARSLLDRLPVVVGAPALDEGQPEYTEPPQVVHADAGGGTETHGRGDPSRRAVTAWQPTGEEAVSGTDGG